MKPADRIATENEYFFDKRNRTIESLRNDGLDVIRMDVGSPDMPPAAFIIDAMIEALRRPSAHGYTAYGGPASFREAVAEYYAKRFGVQLDPKTQVLGLIGSKEGVFKLNQAVLNPGDVALVPSPGYTTYASGARIAGAEIFPVALREENGFLPDYKTIPMDILRRAKILWINYPNNPTGAIATPEFFTETVAFARKYGLLVAHDAPYMDICFDGYVAPSLLQTTGALDVAIELNSLSKTYNMAGWRVGMACGNAEVVGFLSSYKVQSDSSHFGPIWHAAITALRGETEWLDDRNQVYAERRDITVQALTQAGISHVPPQAAIYVWAKNPTSLADDEFSEKLLRESGVSVTPGTIYGVYGAGYFRLSLCTPSDRIRTAMSRLAVWVEKNR